MSYIWENYNENKKFIVSDKNISPYLEVFSTDEDIEYVNIFKRFSELFLPERIIQNEKEYIEILNKYMNDSRYIELANLAMHYLAQLDRIKALSSIDLISYNIFQDINKNVYGEKLKNNFLSLSRDKQKIILNLLAKYNENNQIETVYDEALYRCFSKVRIYYEKPTNKVHIYIGKEETENNKILLRVINYLFLDVGVNIRVMWKNEHFGIIGIDETMIIDNISLV